MRRQLLALIVCMIAPTTASGRQPSVTRAAPPAPRSVEGLVRRANAEAPDAAVRTLAKARLLAEAKRDRAALLAVADAAFTLGKKQRERYRFAAALPLDRLSLGIRERLIPETLDHARSLRAVGADLPSANARDALPLLRHALQVAEKLAPGSLDVATSLYNLGVVASGQGDLATAKNYYLKALAIREKLAPGSLDVATSLYNLGVVADHQGDPAVAKDYYLKALAIQEKLAPSSLDSARSLNNLGNIANRRRDLATAKDCFLKALAIQEKLAPGSLELATSLYNLGVMAWEQSDLAAAKDYTLRALAIQEKLAPRSPDVTNSLSYLGGVANLQGDLAAAKDYFQKSLAIRENVAQGSLAEARNLSNLGVVADDQGDLAAAKDYYLKALGILEKVVPGSRDVAMVLSNLGNVAADQGDRATASEHYLKALAILEKVAPGSLEVALVLINLGAAALRLGDLDVAKDYHQKALAILEKVAPGSLDVALVLMDLGVDAEHQGNLAGAKDYYLKALAIQEKLAPGSIRAAYTLANLGDVAFEKGDVAEAGHRYERALEIIDRRAPQALIATKALRGLARALTDQGKPDAARPLLQRADKIDERTRSVPRDPGHEQTRPEVTSPEVRFLEPPEDNVVKGNEVSVRFVLLAPIPLTRYRVWVNGRPLGGERGFELPKTDPKGQILEKGQVLEKGQLLEKGEQREALAKGLPQEIADLVRKPQYAHYARLRITVPVEDTDGEFVRISIQAETSGGTVSDRQILPLRRPEARLQRGALRVLTIGVAGYQNLPKLRYSAEDAMELGQALRAQAGEDRLYDGAGVTSLVDSNATLAQIRDALDTFTRNVRPGETLILALSGHGLKKGDATYFAPVRCDPENIEGTGLPWSEVLAKLEEVRKTAKAVWVLADCCRAAPGLRKDVVAARSRDIQRGVEEGGNLIICTASSGDTPSYESEDLKHGIFTAAWLEALSGKAPAMVYEDVARGRVLTLSGLQFAVDSSVRRMARTAGVRQIIEFPQLVGSFSPSMPVFVPVDGPK